MGFELIVMICIGKPAIPDAENRYMQMPYVECAKSGVMGFDTKADCLSFLNEQTVKGGNFTFAYCQRRS